MDNIFLTISRTYFCRRFKELGISVIIQYLEELDDIIKEYPNLVETNRYNLINGSIQIDLELTEIDVADQQGLSYYGNKH